MSTTERLENTNTENESSGRQVSERDCAVCLQKCHYPTQLPCGHIFCFLCVKGVARQSKKCAMCRAEIPPDYLDNPVILEKISAEQISTTQSSEGYQWYYEGRNGWWKYDEVSNNDLEAAFNAQDAQCKLLLAGALYCIDFQSMMQMQSRDPTKRRRVRRDLPTLPAKGIAGIKIIEDRETKSDTEGETTDVHEREVVVEIVDDSNDVIQIEDTESASTEDNGLGDLMQRISSIDLQGTVEENDASPRYSPEVENT